MFHKAVTAPLNTLDHKDKDDDDDGEKDKVVALITVAVGKVTEASTTHGPSHG